MKARGNLRPIGNSVTKDKVTFPWGHQFEVDQLAVNDAALTGTMLAGSVSNCLQNVECKCAYLVTLILAATNVSLRESKPPLRSAKKT